MTQFPQLGGCLCGDVRYRLAEDPLVVYACHCSDCQTMTGSSFALSITVRSKSLECFQGGTETHEVPLADGRIKVRGERRKPHPQRDPKKRR